jgi:hypothetical protein
MPRLLLRKAIAVVIREASIRRQNASAGRRMSITCVLTGVCVLAGGLSCPDEPVRLAVSGQTDNTSEVSIFFTGSELGALKPCGCSGGQLGGLSKRTVVFDRVPAGSRAIVDTGTLVAGTGEQDLIKFRILFEAFRLLGYDLVHLTDEDVQIAHSLGLEAPQEGSFSVIGTHWGPDQADPPRIFVKRLAVRGRQITVRFAALDARTASPESAAEAFGVQVGAYCVDILILRNADADSRPIWTAFSDVDCIVWPSDSDEPQILSEPGQRPLVFTVGRFGRHISRLSVGFSDPDAGPALSLEDIPVEETLPENESLARLYRQYQQIVSQSDLLEKYPRVPLPGQLQYVGSGQCRWCHVIEHAEWSPNPHADAFATLVEVGSDRDPECVICHVVGMDRETGYINEERTPHLKDVGCESCHGPGSEHIRSNGYLPTTEPKMTCLDCHTPDHSSGYAGHEDEFREKIRHWWEP